MRFSFQGAKAEIIITVIKCSDRDAAYQQRRVRFLLEQVNQISAIPAASYKSGQCRHIQVLNYSQNICSRGSPHHTFTRRKRSAFKTTEIEDALIAKAANIGPIRIPKKGKRTPAATGTPDAL